MFIQYWKYSEVKDPRNQSYIDYSNRVMHGTLFFKSTGGIASMQDMTRMFNDEQVVSNLYSLLGNGKQDYLPHHVTLNEYLERLKPSELEKIQQDIVYRMIRRKPFNAAKVLGKWLVIVDGTELDEGLELEKEYQAIPEKTFIENAEFVNEVIFKEGTVNVLKYKETRVKKGEEVTTAFTWITSFRITEKNAWKLAYAGRNRWKIENQGFNRQKRWQGNIKHACSYNENAQKCHYLMEQIADFIKQLYEFFYLAKHEIIKAQKNISSFVSQLWQTKEDISQNDIQGISVN